MPGRVLVNGGPPGRAAGGLGSLRLRGWLAPRRRRERCGAVCRATLGGRAEQALGGRLEHGLDEGGPDGRLSGRASAVGGERADGRADDRLVVAPTGQGPGHGLDQRVPEPGVAPPVTAHPARLRPRRLGRGPNIRRRGRFAEERTSRSGGRWAEVRTSGSGGRCAEDPASGSGRAGGLGWRRAARWARSRSAWRRSQNWSGAVSGSRSRASLTPCSSYRWRNNASGLSMTSWSASADMATPWLERTFEYSAASTGTERAPPATAGPPPRRTTDDSDRLDNNNLRN